MLNNIELISDFVTSHNGDLKALNHEKEICLTQVADGKSITLKETEIDEVLFRKDERGKSFLQVNFMNDVKLLITEHLIGFKPTEVAGLESGRIPKVVTTPDLLNIIEAFGDGEDYSFKEIDTLKKVYMAILAGGESVGFKLDRERQWLSQINNFAASA